MEIFRAVFLFSVFGVAIVPCGCRYKSLTTAETDVVLTLKDEGRDYSKLKTYSLAPEVIDLCRLADDISAAPGEFGLGGFGGSAPIVGDNCFTVDHSLDATILSTIAENFDELGYRQILDIEMETPDVVVMSAIVARDNWFIGWGWCDPYYYAGCWYPTYSYAYNLPTGTILVHALDVEQSEEGDWSHVWTAALQGLYAESSQLTGEQRVERAIDQAFQQSSYLEVGGEK